MNQSTISKAYLGDSVYVRFDGEYLIITTENGTVPSNEIYLDEDVVNNLVEYLMILEANEAKKAL